MHQSLNKKSCRFLWYTSLVLLIVIFISISILMTIYLFTYFVPNKMCKFNNLFISFVSGSCFLFFIIAIFIAAIRSKKTVTIYKKKKNEFLLLLLLLLLLLFYLHKRENVYLFAADSVRFVIRNAFGLVGFGKHSGRM